MTNVAFMLPLPWLGWLEKGKILFVYLLAIHSSSLSRHTHKKVMVTDANDAVKIL